MGRAGCRHGGWWRSPSPAMCKLGPKRLGMPSTWTLVPCLPTIAERAMQKSQGPALPFQRLPWHETHVHVHTLHVGRNTAPQHMVNTCKTTSSVAQTRSPRQRWTRCPKRAGGQGICIQSNKSRKTRNADGGHATLGHPSSALFGSVAMRVLRHRGSLRKAQSHVGIRQTWIPSTLSGAQGHGCPLHVGPTVA